MIPSKPDFRQDRCENCSWLALASQVQRSVLLTVHGSKGTGQESSMSWVWRYYLLQLDHTVLPLSYGHGNTTWPSTREIMPWFGEGALESAKDRTTNTKSMPFQPCRWLPKVKVGPLIWSTVVGWFAGSLTPDFPSAGLVASRVQSTKTASLPSPLDHCPSASTTIVASACSHANPFAQANYSCFLSHFPEITKGAPNMR